MSKFHSFLITQRSFMAVHKKTSSQMVLQPDKHPSSISLVPLNEGKPTPERKPSNLDLISEDDSEYFKFVPDKLAVHLDEIIHAIPFGKMQWYLIFFHFFMYVSTSFLIYNYCFFLM